MTETPLRVAVAGNPNVGKTSLFNALTGLRYRVGNYAGITVEIRSGALRGELPVPVELFDLPGAYSLSPQSEDERAAHDALAGVSGPGFDAVLVVLDATNLSRNLYLLHQIAELGRPCIVALNMVDAARAAGLSVDAGALSSALGVPVVETVAREGEGVATLTETLAAGEAAVPRGVDEGRLAAALSEDARAALQGLSDAGGSSARGRWLLGAHFTGLKDDPLVSARERTALHAADAASLRSATTAVVQWRYAQVGTWLSDQPRGTHGEGTTAPAMRASARIDRVLTHRVAGPLVFVAVMALLFQSIFSWSDPFMGLIEEGIGWLSQTASTTLGEGMFTDLLTEGVIAGVGNVLVFVPQIVVLFLGVAVLEETGYMARAAFIIDRVMSRVGLSGKSFVPLLGGYACAIPAIMSTRTIPKFRDRVATIMMVPFISCSARLPVYALLVGALFEADQRLWGPFSVGGAVLLAMYGLSTVGALAAGAIYKRTLLRGPTPPLVLELPPYRLPRLRDLLAKIWDRTMDFIRDAGTIILTFTILLWGLFTFPRVDPSTLSENESPIEYSVAGQLGHAMEPVLSPIGQDWRTGIGLIGSFAAREVFVSTMGLAYGIEGAGEDDAPLRQRLREDKDPSTGERRHTPRSGLALMVFFVFACQCMSTLAVVRRETRSWRWPLLMLGSMTAVAYLMALAVYQVGGWFGFA